MECDSGIENEVCNEICIEKWRVGSERADEEWPTLWGPLPQYDFDESVGVIDTANSPAEYSFGLNIGLDFVLKIKLVGAVPLPVNGKMYFHVHQLQKVSVEIGAKNHGKMSVVELKLGPELMSMSTEDNVVGSHLLDGVAFKHTQRMFYPTSLQVVIGNIKSKALMLKVCPLASSCKMGSYFIPVKVMGLQVFETYRIGFMYDFDSVVNKMDCLK